MMEYFHFLPPDSQWQSYPYRDIVDSDGEVDMEPHEDSPVPR